MRRLFTNAVFGLGYVALLVLFAGLIAHRSYAPVWLGRYSTMYLLALCALGALVLFWKPIFLWLSRETAHAWRGRVLRVRPVLKWAGVTVALVSIAGVFEWRMRAAHPWERAPDPALVRQFHPFLQNEWVPGDLKLHVNDCGFRGDPLVAGTYDVLIVMLGGSTVFSHDVPYPQSHPVLLQESLRQRYPGVRILVQNAGNEYHTTLHSLIKYVTRIRKHQPDVVIMWHGINDLCRSFGPNRFTLDNVSYSDDYRHYLGPIAGILQYYATPVPAPPFMHSVLLAWVKNALFSEIRSAWNVRKIERKLEPVKVETFPSLAAFENNLDALLRVMRADGTRIVVASEPSMYGTTNADERSSQFWMQKSLCRMGDRYPDVESMRKGMAAFNAVSRRLAQQHGVLFLDLDGALPREPEYMFDDCHYTAAGNRRVADIVAEFLVQNKVVDGVLTARQPNDPSSAHAQSAPDDAGELANDSP